MSDDLEIEDGAKIEETNDAEDVASDDDRPVNRTYYVINNCQAVYVKSFNNTGNKVRDAGNQRPQVSCMSCSLLLLQFMAQNIHIWSIRSW